MKRLPALEALIVFAATFLYLSALPDCFSLFDEGIFASIAARVGQGDLLYRDVSTHYLPGAFWLLATLFRVAGGTVSTLRWSLAVLASTAAILIWWLARPHTGRAPAILAALSPAVACYPIWWMASPHWYSTFEALGAAVLLQQALTRPQPALWFAAAGAAVAVTILFLQPIGIAILGLVAVVTVCDRWWMYGSGAMRNAVVQLAAGALIPVVAVALYFAAYGQLTAAWSQAFAWNLSHYSSAFRISYGTIPFGLPKDLMVRFLNGVFSFVLPVVYCVAWVVLVRRYAARVVNARDRALLALMAVAQGLWLGNLYYPDLVHLASSAPPLFAVVAILASYGRPRLWITAVWLAILIALGGGALRRSIEACPETVDTSRGRIAASVEAAADLRPFFAYVSNNVPAGASAFVYPYAPGYYFLSGLHNPTRHEYFFPYLPGAHSDEQLNEIAAELAQTRPQFVVLSLLWGRSMLSRYDTPIERYIRSAYHVAQQFPQTVLMERDAPGKEGPKIALEH